MSVRKASKQNINASFSITNPGTGGLTPPTVTNVIYTDSSYNTLDDLAVGLTGGYARILGSNFYSGISIYLNGTQVNPSNITVVSPTEVRCILPSAGTGYYALMLFNASNAGYIKPNGLFYSPFPTYNAPITLSLVNNLSVSQQLSVTGDAPLVFIIVSGSLPNGLSMNSSGLLTGTVTGYSILTSGSFTVGVDDAQYQSITQVVSWSVSVSDAYFNLTPLLLSADSTIQAQSFVADNSINNSQITVVGDTRAQSFNPYQLGYYSNYFDNVGDYLTLPNSSNFAFGTGDFTIEFWILTNDTGGGLVSQNAAGGWSILINGSTLYWQSSWNTTNLWNYSAATIINNSWHHLAFSRVSGSTKFFIDGVLAATNADTTNYALTTGSIIIGRDANPADFFGYISNLRILKGTGLYTTAFTPPTTPLTAITNTQLLTCQSNSLVDRSINNLTITKNGDTTVSTANPFATKYVAGTQYYSASFNGSSDYLTTPSSTAFAFGTGDFTIEAWVYLNTTGSTQRIVSNGSGNDDFLLVNTGSNVYLDYFDGTTDFTTGSNYVPVSTWTHVAVTRATNTIRLFINGTQAGTGSSSANHTTAQTVYIGRFGASAMNYLNGIISNVRIVKGQALYTAAFTPSTTPLTTTSQSATASNVSLLTCQSSTFIDNSTNNFTITQATTTVKPLPVSPFTPSSYSSTAITTYGSGYFDGTGDQLTIASPNATAYFGTGDFTIEFWIYMNVVTTNTAGVFSNMTDFYVNFRSSGTIGLTDASTVYATTASALTGSAWFHVAVVRSSGSSKIYTNGVGGTAVACTVNWTSTAKAYIGGDTNGTLNGYLSDLRIVRGTALYTTNFVPGFTSPLTNITNTQLLTLQTNGSHNNSTFKDSSSFNNLITRTGNVTNGTFSPYGDNWGISGDNTGFIWGGTTVTIPGAFTFEGWFYFNAITSNVYLMGLGTNTGGQTPYYEVTLTNSGTTLFCALTSTVAGVWQFQASYTAVLNTWTHIAAVSNGTTVTFYVNGTSRTTTLIQGSYPNAYQPSLYPWAGGILYGGGGARSDGVNGFYSNIRIVNGTAVYTGNFTPSSSPLTAITNTIFLVANSNLLRDSSAMNHTITKVGTATVQKSSPFNLVTISKYYSNNFDGTGDFLNTASSTTLALATSDFTIECWFNTTAKTNSYPVVVSNGNFGSNKWQIDDRHATAASTKLIFGLYNASTSPNWLVSTTSIQNNTWYHVAIVRSGSTFTMYLNGVAESTQTYAGSVDGGTAQTIYVGQDGGQAGTNYNGNISNLRITKGVAVYTGAFTPPTNPLSATQSIGTNISAITGAQTSLLTCQSSTLVDNSTNAFAITAGGDAKPIPVSPFTPTINTTPLSYDTTVFSGSMYFDGTGDYLVSPHLPNQWMGTSDFTIEGWIYTTKTGAEQVFVGKQWQGSANAYASYVIYLEAGNTVRTLCSTSGGAWEIDLGSSTAVVKQYVWTHLALTRSGSTFRLFINGLLDKSATNANALNSTTDPLTVGAAGPQTGYNALFQGYMSDVRIIRGGALYTSSFYPGTSPLTSTQTIGTTVYGTTMFLNGTSGGVIDATRTLDLETVGDAKITPVSPYNGNYYSNYFDGTNDYLSSPYNAALDMGTGDCTIECWFYITANTPTNTDGNREATLLSTIRSDGGALTQDYSIGISGNATTTGTGITFNQRTAGTNYSLTYTATITQGVWHHVAVSRTGNTLNLLYDGARVAQNTNFTASITTATGGNPLKIGGLAYSAGYPQYLNGSISNVRLIKGTALYTDSTYTVPTSPLTAITNTVVLTCQSNKFIDNSTNAFTITVNGDTKVVTQNPFQVNTGQSYYFDGTGDYLSTPTSPNLDFNTGDFTVEAWVYPNSLSSDWFIASASGSGGFFFGYSSTTTLGYGWGRVGTAWDYRVGSTATTNQWQHVAVTRSGTSMRLFVNGTQQGTTQTISTAYNMGTTSTTIGSQGASYLMTGYISDLRITKGYARYTATFTPSPIAAQTK